jgi:hypothetical protein
MVGLLCFGDISQYAETLSMQHMLQKQYKFKYCSVSQYLLRNKNYIFHSTSKGKEPGSEMAG